MTFVKSFKRIYRISKLCITSARSEEALLPRPRINATGVVTRKLEHWNCHQKSWTLKLSPEILKHVRLKIKLVTRKQLKRKRCSTRAWVVGTPHHMIIGAVVCLFVRRCKRRVHFAKIHFGNLCLKAVGHSVQQRLHPMVYGSSVKAILKGGVSATGASEITAITKLA